MTQENIIVRRVVIRGRVQGVGYRAWTEDAARTRGLEGWVRNRRDGTVEAVFAGPAKAVAEMIEVCRAGPPGAGVSAVNAADDTAAVLEQRRRGERFSVLPTA